MNARQSSRGASANFRRDRAHGPHPLTTSGRAVACPTCLPSGSNQPNLEDNSPLDPQWRETFAVLACLLNSAALSLNTLLFFRHRGALLPQTPSFAPPAQDDGHFDSLAIAPSQTPQKSELSLTRWASSVHSFRPCRAGMLGSVRKESAASSGCHRTTDHTLY